jgi:hypothetical protein
MKVYYRDEKTFLVIEKFYSRTPDGIRQELFAIMVMALISRMLMFITDETADKQKMCERAAVQELNNSNCL